MENDCLNKYAYVHVVSLNMFRGTWKERKDDTFHYQVLGMTSRKKAAVLLDFVQITPLPIWTTCWTFPRRRNSIFERQFRTKSTICTILRKKLLYWPKMHLMKMTKKLGSPPSSFGQNPKGQQFFLYHLLFTCFSWYGLKADLIPIPQPPDPPFAPLHHTVRVLTITFFTLMALFLVDVMHIR